MDKYKAIYLMQQGLKMTHRLFSGYEYIYMKDGEIYDENDYKMTGGDVDFWTDRKGLEWEEGWSIYKTDADLLMEANPGIGSVIPFIGRTRYDSPIIPYANKYACISKNSHKRTNKKR